MVGTLLGPLLPLLGVEREDLNDVVDPACHAATVITGLEARKYRVFDDEFRHRVGEVAFQAVTDLDAHFAFVRRNDQQGAAVLFFLTNLPMTSKLVAVVFN